MRITIKNFFKIDLKVVDISQFFDFQYGSHPSKFQISVSNRVGLAKCIIIPNFIKIGKLEALLLCKIWLESLQ